MELLATFLFCGIGLVVLASCTRNTQMEYVRVLKNKKLPVRRAPR